MSPSDENLRAHFQKNYLMRYAVLAGVCLLLACWFAYDGFIGYPSQLPMASAYDELRELEDDERRSRWQALSSENGWPSETPEKTAEEIRTDITGQYLWAVINLLVGLPALAYFIRCRGSWVEQTEAGLTTSWGQSVRFADVTRLNKKRWAEKGIAKAAYTEGGRSKTFVFDDFKFERDPLGSMLRSLEEVLDRDQIVGGPTEAETDAQKALEAEDPEDVEELEDAESEAEA